MKKRLKYLADMVPSVNRVIDVGTDHALLDIYLAKKYLDASFLAIDISSEALKNAKNNIIESNLDDRIQLLLNDGLKNVEILNDDFIVISGLGTNTIIKIIEEKKEEINNILIQSNRDIELLRKYMYENGFIINDEKIVYDDNYYIFIYFKKGIFKYKAEDLWLGPIVKKSKNNKYFEYLLKKYKKILPGIPDNDLKKDEYIRRIEYLENLTEKK